MSDEDLWYRIGYAIERARTGTADENTSTAMERLRDRVGQLAGTVPSGAPRRNARARKVTGALPSTDTLLLGAYTSLGVTVLKRWRPRHRVSFLDLIRGGAAGAAATLLVSVLRPMIGGSDTDDDDGETTERLMRAVLAGIGEGVVYAAAIEPRLPGPPSLRGAAFGTASFILAPLGGLTRLLRPLSPHRKIPVLGNLLEDDSAYHRAYLEALIVGVAVAVFYGSEDSKGILIEEE